MAKPRATDRAKRRFTEIEFDEIRILTEPKSINWLLNCRGISAAKFFVDLYAFLAFSVNFIRDFLCILLK
jgi:hypothetical protein